MLHLHALTASISLLMRRTPVGFQSLIIILVCLLTHQLVAFAQCATPSFAAPTSFSAGDGPNNIAIGDFNGDGKLDLALPNINTDRVSILIGNGVGSFTLTGSFPVGRAPTFAAAGDFNGDSKPDLAVVNNLSFSNGDMSVLIGNGAGGFGAPTSYRVIAFNSSVTVGDLNNDGKLDLVAGTYSESLGNVKVLLGDGAGNFGTTADFGGNGDGYSAVIGDFNGDGKSDVAIAINSQVGFDFGTGTKIQVLMGDGTGGLGVPTDFAVGTGPTSIAVGDLNSDGKVDLAVANDTSNNVSVLLGNGAGGFGAATNFAIDSSNLGPSGPPYPLPFASFPRSVAVGDVNGDGKPDLAVTNARAGTVSLLLGNGTGGFSSPSNIVLGTQPVSVVLSDFNGDNKLDLAAANIGSDDVSILINTCSGAAPNPIDDTDFFVRQHYRDFLNREPDAGGLAFWTNEIISCGSNTECVEVKRIHVSAAFFLSIEFQETGYLVYRMFKSAFGNLAEAPVPVRFSDLVRDTQQIGQGVQVGIGNWQAQLEANKQAFAIAFVQRPEFLTAYPNTLTANEVVTKLDVNAGALLSTTEKGELVAILSSTPSDVAKRAMVLRSVAENSKVYDAEFNRAFVLMQYMGYLRRNPNDSPDSDFSGYNFWLNKLNAFGGSFINAEMVKAFLSSDEYRNRFVN